MVLLTTSTPKGVFATVGIALHPVTYLGGLGRVNASSVQKLALMEPGHRTVAARAKDDIAAVAAAPAATLNLLRVATCKAALHFPSPHQPLTGWHTPCLPSQPPKQLVMPLLPTVFQGPSPKGTYTRDS